MGSTAAAARRAAVEGGYYLPACPPSAVGWLTVVSLSCLGVRVGILNSYQPNPRFVQGMSGSTVLAEQTFDRTIENLLRRFRACTQ
jgi:hypothetical protein